MWIVLNPEKAHRFVTKGINLHKGSPTAYVDPNLEPEYRARVQQAIHDGTIIEIESNTLQGMTLPKQATLDAVETEDTDKIIKVETSVDEDGNRVTLLQMPDEDGKVQETKQGGSGIIMTGVRDMPLEDDEDGDD